RHPAPTRFGGAAGVAWAGACPACTHVNPPDHRFCGACGASLVAAPDPIPKAGHEVARADVVARKIVTVVFADLIGSTALHERLDAESVRSLMGRYYGALHPTVEAPGGQVGQPLRQRVTAGFGAA